MRSHYYDRSGKPLFDDIMTWGRLRDDESYMRLGYDRIGDVEVITVWQGINLTMGADPPHLFETMVFGGEDAFGDLGGRRYATEQEAHEGHARVVANLCAGQPPWSEGEE